MKPKCIAKILPTDQAGGRSIGTGYPIGNGLILTARHVVIYKERNLAIPIEIEWPDLEEPDGNVYTRKVTDIIEFGVQIDIALLKCEVPLPAQDNTLTLASRFPIEHEKWASIGYPQIGKDQKSGSRAQVPAKGEFFPPGSDHKILLTSDSDAWKMEDWCGISGAPVFQGNVLLAVIAETPGKRQECFTAVLIPWLIENNPGFCQAIGIDNEGYQRYFYNQKQLIENLLLEMEGGKVFNELWIKLGLSTQTITPKSLSKKLFDNFNKDCLSVLNILLQASAEGLKLDASQTALDNVRNLFFLFSSLLAPKSNVHKQAFIRLSVYSKMATEIHLASLYKTTPNFVEEKGELKGKCAMDAPVITKEVGWDEQEFTDEVVKTVSLSVRKKEIANLHTKFERRRLNKLITQLQDPSENELYRIELNRNDPEMENHPLQNEKYIKAVNNENCLPNFPIVHFGDSETELEAEVCAILEGMFRLLNKYGH